MRRTTGTCTLLAGSGMLTPTGYKDRPKVAINICDKHVTPAPKWIVGTCPFYYRPLHGAYLETVEKVSMSSIWSTIKGFALSWDPWTDSDVAHRLLHRREQLIEPGSSDSDWSRHGNFMMRHIGCGHKPPDEEWDVDDPVGKALGRLLVK
ncbi:hypothetical protein [Burkholderia metallica]|nr:hypothetical protein [Burkholderia metallica]